MLEIIGKLQNKLDGMPAFCATKANELEVMAKSNITFNNRTGNALNSFKCTSLGSGGNCEIELSNGAYYYQWLEEGASSHIIEGNPYLYWEGAPFPMRRVNHPGIQPHNDMHNTVESFLPILGSELERYFGDL